MGTGITDTRDQAAFLLDLGRTSADVVPYQAQRGPAFLVNSPSCAAQLLLRDATSYAADPHPYRQLAGHLSPYGTLLLGIDGHERNAEIRNQATAELAALARETVEGLTYDSGGEPVPVLGALHELLLRFAARVLFEVDVTPLAGNFVAAVRLLEECWANELAPDSSMRLLRRDYLDAIAVQNETIAYIERAAAIAVPRGVVLRTLLNSYHATATALAWAIWELARHQSLQNALRAEVDTICRGGAPRSADTRRLDLTRRVVLETLRLHPPAWNIGRILAHDDELAGVCIPEGSYVSVSPYVMHRSHRFWPQADDFIPGRFASGAAAQRVRFAFLPFGAGRQRCPAARHAIEHLQILLAVFVQESRLDAVDVPVRPRGLIGLRPEPDAYLRIVRRSGGDSASRAMPVGRVP